MTFLAPYWLFAASAILVPVAIHLWNRRQGKTVKVGSLRWLEASESRRWRSIKPNGLALLALRCLILILLAMSLAQPVWVRPPEKAAGKKAVFVGEELLYTPAIQSIKPALDALLRRGYTLHRYAPGFAQITPEQWQRISSSAKDSTLTSMANYWRLLPALAAKYKQPQDSLWLFTSDQKRFFTGKRPASVPQNIRWVPVALETETTWLQAATQISNDSLQLIVGQSTRKGISYSRYCVAATATGINAGNLQLQRHADSLALLRAGRVLNKVKVRAKPLHVAILYGQAQQPEVQYLQAAIRAISKYTGQPVRLSAAAAARPDTAADWIFWLRQAEPPDSLLAQAAKYGLQLWIQSAANPVVVRAELTPGGTPVAVHQLSKAVSSEKGAAVWETTAGEPLLTVQPAGRGGIYRFRSGFGPAWSGLGQSAQLPELLLPLLLPQPAADKYDVRALDERQLKPAAGTATSIAAGPQAQRQKLLPWLVAAAALLFLMERTLTGRRRKV